MGGGQLDSESFLQGDSWCSVHVAMFTFGGRATCTVVNRIQLRAEEFVVLMRDQQQQPVRAGSVARLTLLSEAIINSSALCARGRRLSFL